MTFDFFFHRWRAILYALLLVVGVPAGAATPAPLARALQGFRTDGPKGWSFTQVTEGAGESRIERFDAARTSEPWTLLQQNGHPATAEEQRDYRELQSRRSRGGTAPLLTDQFDLAHAQLVSEQADRLFYRCRLKPGEKGDATAEHLIVSIAIHLPTHTVERIEISSDGPFSPTFGVRIREMRTVMAYSLPTSDQPSVPLTVTTRVRGRAFLLKSLDADMTVTFTAHEKGHR